jgi:hypothetical protein
MAEMGHDRQFPSLQLSARCRIGQATFDGTDGRPDAPQAGLAPGTAQILRSTQSSRSLINGQLGQG